MADETASAIVVGCAYIRRRCSLTDRTGRSASPGLAHFKLLREPEHGQVPQLPRGHGRDNSGSCKFMLHGPNDMFGALFFQGDTILYKYASARCDPSRR
jgi:hypothetical protein